MKRRTFLKALGVFLVAPLAFLKKEAVSFEGLVHSTHAIGFVITDEAMDDWLAKVNHAAESDRLGFHLASREQLA